MAPRILQWPSDTGQDHDDEDARWRRRKRSSVAKTSRGKAFEERHAPRFLAVLLGPLALGLGNEGIGVARGDAALALHDMAAHFLRLAIGQPCLRRETSAHDVMPQDHPRSRLKGFSRRAIPAAPEHGPLRLAGRAAGLLPFLAASVNAPNRSGSRPEGTHLRHFRQLPDRRGQGRFSRAAALLRVQVRQSVTQPHREASRMGRCRDGAHLAPNPDGLSFLAGYSRRG